MGKKEKGTSVCYVAGPYRAGSEYLVKRNIRNAEDVAALLWAYGWVPICPHMNTAFLGGAYGLSDSVWLKGDLEIVKRVDFVVVIPGWKFSKGTHREIKTAIMHGKPVFFWENEKHRAYLINYYRDKDKGHG